MSNHNQQLQELTYQGSNAAYWGLAAFTGIGAGLAYFFDSTVIAVIGGIFGLIMLNGLLFSRFRKVMLGNEHILVKRGLLKGSSSIDLNSIEKIALGKENDKPGENILEIDLDKVQDWANLKYIQLWRKGASKPLLSIDSTDFESEEFERMCKGLKQYYVESAGTPLQRAKVALAQTKKYLHTDKELRKDLIDTLNSTYVSVYKPFKTLLSKGIIESLKAEKGILYQAIQQGNVLMYFKEGEYREGIVEGSADLRMARKLIEATESNLDMVQARVDSHENVKQRLERTIGILEQKKSLTDMTKKLDALQQQNFNVDIDRKDVALEAEIIEQLQQLTEAIQRNESLDKSIELREQARLFNDRSENN